MIAGAGLPVEVACRVLGVSGAGYYAWRSRPPSARTVRHAWLTDVIREVYAAAYGSYGARRVHAELVLGRGIRVGHNAVAMLMRRAGIAGRTGAPKRRGMPGQASEDDLVDRRFRREGTAARKRKPCPVWVYLRSQTQSRFGEALAKRRSTRSGAEGRCGFRAVVRGPPRRPSAPCNPSCRISRATRLRPTRIPSVKRSSASPLGEP